MLSTRDTASSAMALIKKEVELIERRTRSARAASREETIRQQQEARLLQEFESLTFQEYIRRQRGASRRKRELQDRAERAEKLVADQQATIKDLRAKVDNKARNIRQRSRPSTPAHPVTPQTMCHRTVTMNHHLCRFDWPTFQGVGSSLVIRALWELIASIPT